MRRTESWSSSLERGPRRHLVELLWTRCEQCGHKWDGAAGADGGRTFCEQQGSGGMAEAKVCHGGHAAGLWGVNHC